MVQYFEGANIIDYVEFQCGVCADQKATRIRQHSLCICRYIDVILILQIMSAVTPNQPIIFYDGLCGLCDRSVQFVLKHDKKALFKFSTLQGAFAEKTLKGPVSMNSFILLYRGKVYRESAAALHTFRLLGGLWRLLFVFIIVPGFIRNTIYRYIARNRYRWFGQFEQCRIPSPATQSRFIDL